MPNKIVTILVALWKAGGFLEKKLINLKQQTFFSQCNIVLLNCQNHDNEAGIYVDFLKHDNVTEIRYDEYTYLYPTWNDGIKSTESEFIMNSNADDMLHPEYVETCSHWLKTHPDFACVSTGVLLTYHPNQVYPNWEHQGNLPLDFYPNSTAGPCPLWRRSLHDKYGYFDPRCSTIGDTVMWEKWYAGGERFGLIKRDMVLYYAHSDSLERRVENGISLRDSDLKRLGRL